MSQTYEASLRSGLEALARHAWPEAYELLATADASGGLSAMHLEQLAEAAFCGGHLAVCIDAYERAYAKNLDEGNPHRAGFIALWLALIFSSRLAASVAAGWRSRADRLLKGEPGCREYGFLEWVNTYVATGQGNFDRALEQAANAFEIGKRHRDRDLQALGLLAKGCILLRKGDVPGGTALLDEAMAAAMGRELTPSVTRIVYCDTITACQSLADYRRAGEWLAAWERQSKQDNIAVFSADCRVHRAQIMRLRGAWAEAQQEASQAVDDWKRWNVGLDNAGSALYEIGEVCRCKGDLAGAKDAFEQAKQLGDDAQPGMSRLLFAEGKLGAAATSIKGALASESLGPLARARCLPAQVEIAIAAADMETAGSATEELEAVAKTYGTTALEASAACARGALDLAHGNASAACRNLRRGLKLWQQVDVPYEAARARVLLAEGCRAEGEEEAALLELQTARLTFDRLGATPDARRATDLLGKTAKAGPVQLGSTIRTFMFTDIVKSTNLVEALGDDAWEDLLRWHDQTLRSLFTAHDGEEIGHAGDGFFVVYRSAPAAIECAVAIQRSLADHRRIHGFAPQVRIGLHTARATQHGPDYIGKGVHVAARIAALAEGERILASAETIAAWSAAPVSNRQTVRLKGISDQLDIATIDWQ